MARQKWQIETIVVLGLGALCLAGVLTSQLVPFSDGYNGSAADKRDSLLVLSVGFGVLAGWIAYAQRKSNMPKARAVRDLNAPNERKTVKGKFERELDQFTTKNFHRWGLATGAIAAVLLLAGVAALTWAGFGDWDPDTTVSLGFTHRDGLAALGRVRVTMYGVVGTGFGVALAWQAVKTWRRARATVEA